MSPPPHRHPAAAPAAAGHSAPASAVSAAVSAPPARRTGVSRSSGARARWLRTRAQTLSLRLPHPELAGLIALAGVLNLWALSRNGWANDYYSAAVRSMSTSWHNFLFASLDPSGVMTVDKPPLALWVQALSVRAFGYHPLSVLVPQALIGVASVVLVYDLVRRRFGRVAGFAGGLALALTPITVAMSRHNNPDALLVLCCVAALWCTVRGLESGRTRWIVLAGVCAGLGFETKMLVALVVVPGIVAAWLWLAPAARGRLHALRQLLMGGAAMLVVGGAWPALVELTPAADRPWVSGTSDNRILSLIFEYNGLGRVDGQAGGPGGMGGGVFGGTPGPLRLLNSALGGQAGWLLGFAAVGALALLVATRLRRSDARSGWLIVVGGAFAVTAVLFSEASGIFHPYYVSLLAPFIAALAGALVGELVGGRLRARIVGPLAVAAGCVVELVVLGDYPGQLTWLAPVLIVVGVLAILMLVGLRGARARAAAVAAVLAVLLIAPGAWAFDTLGHATSGTFPAGGPASVADAGGGGGAFGGGGGAFGRFGGARFGGSARAFGSGAGGGSALQLFGPGGPPAGGGAGSSASAGSSGPGAPPGLLGSGGGRGFGAGAGFGARGGFGGGAGPMGGSLSSTILEYVKHHGGGTIAVASQSSAASAIISGDAKVAGIGGFSGRESDVSVSWLAQEVRAGKIRWVLDEANGGLAAGPPGETRTGSRTAMAAVAKTCRAVTLPARTSTTSASGGGVGTGGSLYDCRGYADQLASVAE
ncbi:MAG TPA: glycosyltransferase family 39 protein [Solirubrobacteraceae bacterium]|nr:glycosyltransferase family 39 protein [Solirubrobacteraceae bacterium]